MRLAALLMMIPGISAPAQEAAPHLTLNSVFVPGLYEAESRNGAFQDQPAKSRICIASADFDALRRETIAQYEASPAFLSASPSPCGGTMADVIVRYP